MSNKLLKKACVVAAASMLPFATMAGEEGVDWNISGWVNQSMLFYDDGQSSDVTQVSDNGTTLGSRITFSGSADLPGTNGWTAGFDITIEPSAAISTNPLTNLNQTTGDNANDWLGSPKLLGESVYVAGNWGKVTLGTQSMPTDNIAVLADPSLTLWSSISPIFRGNAFTIQGLTGSAAGNVWADYLRCFTTPGLGIGLDCNGIYRNGIRYDLPAFGPVSVAIGYANDDIYDIAAKYNGELGRIKTILHLGYAINQGGGGSNVGGSESENFQAQLGLMDPVTGIFGTFAYNNDEADGPGIAATSSDDMDSWWLKVGIKKGWFAPGDTSLDFQYGSYDDAYGTGTTGLTGSEVERIGFAVNQYFGSKLIIYGAWENLDLDADCGGTAAATATCNAEYAGADDLDIFSLGLTYFF